MEDLLGTFTKEAFMFVVFAVIAGLTSIAAYLGWRGRVFGPRSSRQEEPGRLGSHIESYLKGMTVIITSDAVKVPNLGSANFDEEPYRRLLARLDELLPMAGNHHSHHVAFTDALALLVEKRSHTARHLNRAAAHMTQASGHHVTDCASAIGARNLMLTYGSAVDKQLEALLAYCKAEQDAYEAMEEKLTEWRTAAYVRKYGPPSSVQADVNDQKS